MAGRPNTAPSSIRGIASSKVLGGLIAIPTARAYVRVIAIGRTTVPIRSMKTTNCMLKQKVPQRFRTRTSSIRLWMVELIHRRRWERRTLKVSGTIVRHLACGKNIIFLFGNVRSNIVVRNRSSPKRSRFFWWRVVTWLWLYSLTISGFMINGIQSSFVVFRALSRNMEKQPGRQETPPKTDSKALARWCEMKYSKTWMDVTHDWRLLAIRVSPQTPIINWSWCMQLTRCLREEGKTFVSASTWTTIWIRVDCKGWLRTMRQTSKKSGVTPMRTWILRKRSKSRGLMRSL